MAEYPIVRIISPGSPNEGYPTFENQLGLLGLSEGRPGSISNPINLAEVTNIVLLIGDPLNLQWPPGDYQVSLNSGVTTRLTTNSEIKTVFMPQPDEANPNITITGWDSWPKNQIRRLEVKISMQSGQVEGLVEIFYIVKETDIPEPIPELEDPGSNFTPLTFQERYVNIENGNLKATFDTKAGGTLVGLSYKGIGNIIDSIGDRGREFQTHLIEGPDYPPEGPESGWTKFYSNKIDATQAGGYHAGVFTNGSPIYKWKVRDNGVSGLVECLDYNYYEDEPGWSDVYRKDKVFHRLPRTGWFCSFDYELKQDSVILKWCWFHKDENSRRYIKHGTLIHLNPDIIIPRPVNIDKYIGFTYILDDNVNLKFWDEEIVCNYITQFENNSTLNKYDAIPHIRKDEHGNWLPDGEEVLDDLSRPPLRGDDLYATYAVGSNHEGEYWVDKDWKMRGKAIFSFQPVSTSKQILLAENYDTVFEPNNGEDNMIEVSCSDGKVLIDDSVLSQAINASDVFEDVLFGNTYWRSNLTVNEFKSKYSVTTPPEDPPIEPDPEEPEVPINPESKTYVSTFVEVGSYVYKENGINRSFDTGIAFSSLGTGFVMVDFYSNKVKVDSYIVEINEFESWRKNIRQDFGYDNIDLVVISTDIPITEPVSFVYFSDNGRVPISYNQFDFKEVK